MMTKAKMMLRAGIGATAGHPINGFTTNMKKTVTTAAMSKRIASSCPNVRGHRELPLPESKLVMCRFPCVGRL
jgi:hypothetical protein